MVDGRQPLVEDNLQCKKTFSGRQPSVEDELCWRMTFGGRQPSLGDNLGGKITFGGRQPSVEDDLQWKTTFIGSLHAAYSALRHFLKENLHTKLDPLHLSFMKKSLWILVSSFRLYKFVAL